MVDSPTFTPAWLASDDVRHWLRLNAVPDDDDQAEVDRVIVQTETYVQRCRPEWWGPPGPEWEDLTGTWDTIGAPVNTEDPVAYTPDAETYQGAVMYAARQLRRRNSPGGIESFGDVGITFVTKYDADIERSLRTGGWALPGFG